MLCYVELCCAVLCYVVPCRAMLRYVVLCCAILCYVARSLNDAVRYSSYIKDF